MASDNTARFSPRFNLLDPAQRKVADILENQGKRMAQYITNAVLHYEHCSNLGDLSIEYSKLATEIVSLMLPELLAAMTLAPLQEVVCGENDQLFLDGLDAFG